LNRKGKKNIIFLVLIVIGLSFSNVENSFDTNNLVDNNLKLLTDNVLFNGVEYDMTLDDVYDDEDLTKVFTGANFSYVFMENDTVTFNEVVSPVNNTNYKSPSDTDVTMIDGTFDDTDNMRANDDSNSEFTSTTAITQDTIYINAVPMVYGSCVGTISKAETDDSNYFTLTAEYVSGAEAWYVTTDDLGFDIDPAGRSMYISYDIWSSSPTARIKVNGANWKAGSPHLDADDQYHAGVDDVVIWAGSGSSFSLRVYYFKMVEDSVPVSGDLSYTIDMNFDEVDTSKLLAVDVTSFHYTNI